MLTKDLEIPIKEIEQSPKWSMRPLFSMGGSLGKAISSFNPFEFIFLIMVLISGLAELLGRSTSWFWYIIILLMFFSLPLRREEVEAPKKQTKPK